MTRAFLSLGSNVGDRLGHLQQAVAELEEAGLHITDVSPVYETDPVGGPEQGAFFNIVAEVDTWLPADELLAMCHAVEDLHGRTREVKWGPRTLDIDLLAYGHDVFDEEHLTVPHPRAHERAFVLVPWRDVAADFDVPGLGEVQDLADEVGTHGVRLVATHLGTANR